MCNYKEGGGSKPFLVPFVAPTNDDETHQKLNTSLICKEALTALHLVGQEATTALVQHATNGTMPLHGNIGKVNMIIIEFFEDEVIPYAGFRPTVWTRVIIQNIGMRKTKPLCVSLLVKNNNNNINNNQANKKKKLPVPPTIVEYPHLLVMEL